LQNRDVKDADTKVDDTSKEDIDIESLLISIPKQLKNKAKSILHYIIEKTSMIWNEKGEISIGDKRIPFSNIIDLVKDALIAYKHFTLSE
jgi:hypothetical protein